MDVGEFHVSYFFLPFLMYKETMKKIYYIYLTLNYYVDLLLTASQLVLAS